MRIVQLKSQFLTKDSAWLAPRIAKLAQTLSTVAQAATPTSF